MATTRGDVIDALMHVAPRNGSSRADTCYSIWIDKRWNREWSMKASAESKKHPVPIAAYNNFRATHRIRLLNLRERHITKEVILHRNLDDPFIDNEDYLREADKRQISHYRHLPKSKRSNT